LCAKIRKNLRTKIFVRHKLTKQSPLRAESAQRTFCAQKVYTTPAPPLQRRREAHKQRAAAWSRRCSGVIETSYYKKKL